MNALDPTSLTFDENQLIVAVVQDSATGTVLMVAYMNREALAHTIETGQAHFWSRSRKTLWRKGETSGNVLQVDDIQADCDGDALLISARPSGPACHTGERSCFAQPAMLIDRLTQKLHERNLSRPESSYTAKLFAGGRPAILRKLGEEATEVIVAAEYESDGALIHEVADLWFHSMVLLEERGVDPGAIFQELAARRG
jgi:phosphoribosyl-ATP pyrophosphohydrolase/phosphoribosyl-AMP cyclohydrolase